MVHLQRVGEKTSELQADSLIFLCQFILDVYDKAILAVVREKNSRYAEYIRYIAHPFSECPWSWLILVSYACWKVSR